MPHDELEQVAIPDPPYPPGQVLPAFPQLFTSETTLMQALPLLVGANPRAVLQSTTGTSQLPAEDVGKSRRTEVAGRVVSSTIRRGRAGCTRRNAEPDGVAAVARVAGDWRSAGQRLPTTSQRQTCRHRHEPRCHRCEHRSLQRVAMPLTRETHGQRWHRGLRRAYSRRWRPSRRRRH